MTGGRSDQKMTEDKNIATTLCTFQLIFFLQAAILRRHERIYKLMKHHIHTSTTPLMVHKYDYKTFYILGFFQVFFKIYHTDFSIISPSTSSPLSPQGGYRWQSPPQRR